jgi:phage-related minor tail protein
VLADIFASVHLNLETGEFEANAARAADSAATSMGKRMSGLLRTGLGAGVGMALGAALSGANQLDAATRQLQADTGMTATEAGLAEKALAGMYRNNLQGFDEIGAAMAKVHNDLGLTGQAADDATALFLKFATATGQNAAEAVSQADDTLDAWNLTAADSGMLLDKLVASHHRYGGSIAETNDALARMAPAMTAANMSIDDGIALLNLFNAAGIDASKMPQALATALKKVKSPAELKALIADIAATKDPFERATKATELFGNRAGPQLAAALAASGGDLSQFGISMDEAAGATTNAAKAVESGFGAQFQLILKNATGALAEFGTNFGPLIMAASVVGPGLLKGILGGVGGIAGLLGPRMIAMLAPVMASVGLSSGTALGSAIALAIPLGMAAVAASVVVAFKSLILDPGLQQQTTEIGEAVGKQIAGGTVAQLKQSKAALEEGIRQIGGAAGPLSGFLYGGQIDALQQQLDAVDAAIAAAEPKVAASAAKVAATIPDAVETAAERAATAAKSAGDGVAQGLADGITAARRKPVDAFDALIEMLKHPLTKTAEFARLSGQLTSQALADGLRSKDPAIRAQAEAVKDAILGRIAEMKPDAGIIGKDTAKAIADGLRSKDPQVRANAQALKEIVDAALRDLPPAGTAAGAGVVDNLAAYLRSPAGKKKVYEAILGVIRLIQGTIHEFTTHPNTPLPEWKSNDAHPGKDQLAAGGPALAGHPYWVGEQGVPELFVPNVSGTVIPMAQLPGGGNTYQVNVQGLLRARDPFEVANQLRRLSEFGVLTPARAYR